MRLFGVEEKGPTDLSIHPSIHPSIHLVSFGLFGCFLSQPPKNLTCSSLRQQKAPALPGLVAGPRACEAGPPGFAPEASGLTHEMGCGTVQTLHSSTYSTDSDRQFLCFEPKKSTSCSFGHHSKKHTFGGFGDVPRSCGIHARFRRESGRMEENLLVTAWVSKPPPTAWGKQTGHRLLSWVSSPPDGSLAEPPCGSADLFAS